MEGSDGGRAWWNDSADIPVEAGLSSLHMYLLMLENARKRMVDFVEQEVRISAWLHFTLATVFQNAMVMP